MSSVESSKMDAGDRAACGLSMSTGCNDIYEVVVDVRRRFHCGRVQSRIFEPTRPYTI